MIFLWSLSDIKSPKVSRTLLSILVVLNNVVVWIVSTRPPISKSSSPFNNLLVTVPKAPITIGTTIIIIIIIIIILLRSFSHQFLRAVFYWSLSGSKSAQISRTLLSILTDLNNAIFCMVSIHPPIFNSFSPFYNPLGTVPSAPTRIGITIIFTFYYYYYYYYYTPYEFFKLTLSEVFFLRSLSDSQFPQFFKTLLRIQTDVSGVKGKIILIIIIIIIGSNNSSNSSSSFSRNFRWFFTKSRVTRHLFLGLQNFSKYSSRF